MQSSNNMYMYMYCFSYAVYYNTIVMTGSV